jgi:NADPH:quinone reductase-like Zn-dependent oxidoreductase
MEGQDLMQQLIAERFGAPDVVLSFRQSDRSPSPKPGEVVVRMLASAINPSDLLAIGGAYPHRTSLPFVPGFEGVGIIEAFGADVVGIRLGQRVLPLGSAGGWQTYKVAPGHWCIPVPDDLSNDDAALSYVNPLTAHLMLERLCVRPGQIVGINAAASAIGRMLIRLLDDRGARAVAIVRSCRTAQALHGEPVATLVIGFDEIPPLDHGIDAIGGEEGGRMAMRVRAHGVFLHYGLLSGRPLSPELARNARCTVEPFWLRNWVHRVSKNELRKVMQATFASVQKGTARTTPISRFALRDFKSALAFNAADGRRGKALLTL